MLLKATCVNFYCFHQFFRKLELSMGRTFLSSRESSSYRESTVVHMFLEIIGVTFPKRYI